jgi:hypothetical protein
MQQPKEFFSTVSKQWDDLLFARLKERLPDLVASIARDGADVIIFTTTNSIIRLCKLTRATLASTDLAYAKSVDVLIDEIQNYKHEINCQNVLFKNSVLKQIEDRALTPVLKNKYLQFFFGITLTTHDDSISTINAIKLYHPVNFQTTGGATFFKFGKMRVLIDKLTYPYPEHFLNALYQNEISENTFKLLVMFIKKLGFPS